ncbi:MAG: hypothetical protein CMQ41_12590 [Gammaproteobacteria bacterium]|nr:hypothetical protein [Gammaproteobacteria bacterium]
MNWEAIGAVGEIVGALAVVITLVYLASQVRHAKETAADTNRLERSKGVRDMLISSPLNSEFQKTLTKGLNTTDYYSKLGSQLNLSAERAATFDWAMAYWFWLHWGQYASTTKESDIEELRHLISQFYGHPNLKYCWANGPWGRPMLEENFVKFVDEILANDPKASATP